MFRNIWDTKVPTIKSDDEIKRAFKFIKQLRSQQTEDAYFKWVHNHVTDKDERGNG
ncbi:hypothetical protein [Phocicoccus pinnipedialis]|uniref:hypothetical protein n=1 Tax=Phocicoccus pinnipedialis TaxID=110845 RepID=UPI00163FF516|nr:hypothetical protein [Jeotgalicoccus pinnipedialis]MBP1939770.1 hypothetical protein [Jeotgalicoccus pinnipedialis]